MVRTLAADPEPRRAFSSSPSGRSRRTNFSPHDITSAPRAPIAQMILPNGVNPNSSQICLNHLKALDPDNDKSPLEPVTNWVFQEAARWPPEYDNLIERFMHENNFYEPLQVLPQEDHDRLYTRLIRRLTAGSSIERVSEREFGILKKRTESRVHSIAKGLGPNLIALGDKGRIQKSAKFQEFWSERYVHWKANSSMGKTPNRQLSNDDHGDEGEILEDVGDEIIVHPPNAAAETSGEKSMASLSSLLSKRSENLTPLESCSEQNPRKRQRISASEKEGAKPQEPAPRSLSREDPRSSRPQSSSDSNINKESHPNPSPRGSLFLPRSINTPQPSAIQTPMTPDGGQASRPIPQQNARLPPPSRRLPNRIYFIFQMGDCKTYDLARSIPGPRIGNLSVGEFFELFSRRSNVPLQKLPSVTLEWEFALGGTYKVVVGREEEEKWKCVLDDVECLYRRTKMKSRGRDSRFEVWVDVGEREREKEDREEECWGGGFVRTG